MVQKVLTVPSMGESIVQVSVAKILVPSGAFVEQDQELIELETEKVNQVLFAPFSGQVAWSVQVGESIPIGAPLGVIEKTETQVGLISRPKEPTAPSIQETKHVVGSRETRKPLSKIRQTIGERMLLAKQKTAMLTTFNEVDLSRVIEMRTQYSQPFLEKFGTKLGYMSFFVKAAVSALIEYPEINSYLDGQEIVERHDYDISIAVSTERGTFVPVLHRCDQLSFGEIEQQIDAYAKQAREGTISFSALQGGGFTITNGGVFGSLLSTPLLNPPQCAILGMHKIQKRVVVVEDQMVIRPMMYLALSYDHCLVDGKEAISFLGHVKNQLEDPSRFLLGI